ncbi:MAG TPA: CPBP family intramembrane glutamic endopeptidase, partial [Gemmataceae bacterium]|jgi:membrane protease YdiL (CAAX protease family)|nr:CPBP family intramembrane glutamic endopeptidase [Gemmataceae bacterium]
MKLLYSAGKVIQFSLPALFWLATDRSHFRYAKPKARGMLTGIAFGLLVALAVQILVLYLSHFKHRPMLEQLAEQVRIKVAAFGLTSPALFLLFGAFLCVIHSGLEEYYWRAFVFAGWRKLLPLRWAIAISSLGFMAHHVVVLNEYFPGHFWTATLPFSLAVACGGAVWAWMYQRYGNIYPVWVSHALVDAAIMAIGWRLIFFSSWA